MLRLVFSSTLTLILISCPLRCSVGLHVFKLLDRSTTIPSASTVCASCCSKSDSQPATPIDESHSDSGCFCVCGGAILLNHSNLQWTPQYTDFYYLSSDRNLDVGEHNQAVIPQCDTSLETDGRTLQTRLMSFLC